MTGKENKASRLSREHRIDLSQFRLVTVVGRMAEDTLDAASCAGLLEPKKCLTRDVPLRGCPVAEVPTQSDENLCRAEYDTDGEAICLLEEACQEMREPIDPAIRYAASTVEDVLSRRSGALPLNAGTCLHAAGDVAGSLAREVKQDAAWARRQTGEFDALVQAHSLP